jgi:hypothetical protein
MGLWVKILVSTVNETGVQIESLDEELGIVSASGSDRGCMSTHAQYKRANFESNLSRKEHFLDIFDRIEIGLGEFETNIEYRWFEVLDNGNEGRVARS